MIISVLNQKGGVGKTTLSVNIAARLAADGARVLLLDADPQEVPWTGLRRGKANQSFLCWVCLVQHCIRILESLHRTITISL